jgi:UPF0489 domain
MNYYIQETFLTTPIGNNSISFERRKEQWSDGILRIPPLIEGTINDIKLLETWICYEYVSDKDVLVSSFGLDTLVHITQWNKDIFVMDNHNHAFSCRWKSYMNTTIPRWSHLIHIDQHSDLNEVVYNNTTQKIVKNTTRDDIAVYTNEVLDIASFIKPAKEIWLITDYEMILTEYSLLQFQTDFSSISSQSSSCIVDIDLDFRAPEMGIEYYYQTIKKVRQLIDLPNVRCISIASSPTYIHQQRALAILHDILS